MPRFAPVKAFVTSAEIGGGKAVIEIKNPRSTMTLELPEDSGWIANLPEGAFVTYTIEVELPHGIEPATGGPQPGDQVKTSEGIVTIPGEAPQLQIVRAANVPPSPEEIRQLHPIPGQRTVGIDSAVGTGESVRDLLGLPDHSNDPVVETANANLSGRAVAPSASPTPL